MNTSFYKKLTDLREERNMKQIDVVRAINERFGRSISKSMYSKWENGKEEPRRFQDVAALAQLYGVSTDWLMGLSEDKFNKGQKVMDNFRRIPVLSSITEGIPIFAQKELISYEIVNASDNVDFCLQARGDSMENACIFDGSIVFIRKQSKIETGEIAVVIIEGETMLKRFYYINGNVILRPENPNFKDIAMSAKESKTLQILGKAVYVKSNLR